MSAVGFTSARPRPVVAIDGPAGAGKSTVARRLADELGFVLVDTGAMYRTVALVALRRGIDVADGAACGAVAASLVEDHALTFERSEDASRGVRVILAGSATAATTGGAASATEDVSDAIRSPEMALAASRVSAHPEVRAPLLDLQRQAGAGGGVVLEGRDIGTVVFPDAEAKVFLTADPAVRARRRYAELQARGQTNDDGSPLDLAQLEREIRQRDAQDASREIAPLRQADGALYIDSSKQSVEQTVSELRDFVHAQMKTPRT